MIIKGTTPVHNYILYVILYNYSGYSIKNSKRHSITIMELSCLSTKYHGISKVEHLGSTIKYLCIPKTNFNILNIIAICMIINCFLSFSSTGSCCICVTLFCCSCSCQAWLFYSLA